MEKEILPELEKSIKQILESLDKKLNQIDVALCEKLSDEDERWREMQNNYNTFIKYLSEPKDGDKLLNFILYGNGN